VVKPRANPGLAKIHRSYTVEEIATLYGVHRNTVRQWIKAGLRVVDDRRPVLVLGAALAGYLRNRRALNKRPCRPGEIYCVRCREPRAPAGGLVRYHPLTPTRGSLVGTCPACAVGLYRSVSVADLGRFAGLLRITLPLAGEHIGKTFQPSVNSDLTQDAPDHANAPS
jgi:excisionase family DNA binding protein